MFVNTGNKIKRMQDKKPGYKTAIGLRVGLFLIFILLLLPGTSWAIRNTRALCLECHPKAAGMLSRRNVHKPVELGLCAACHNPHASRREKLIDYSVSELCYTCHEKRRILSGEVLHSPVKEGRCLECHDSHSTDAAGLLNKTVAEVCYQCHPKKDITGGKIIHPEVRKGNCLTCHSPHSSDTDGLVKKNRKSICIGCHPSDAPSLSASHGGMTMTGADCLECHNPHSSDNRGILKANLHKPFEEKKCASCHLPSSVKITEDGVGLCTKCHENTLTGFNKRYSHLVSTVSRNPCTACHSPHSSDYKSLLRDKERRVCYSCHEDTKKSEEKSKFRHTKLSDCSNCHVSHSSDSRYFMANGEDTCSMGACHATQGRFTHPIGEKVIDPRTNSAMGCSTCHNPMGSPEEFVLRAGKDKELCEQCHQI